VSLAQKVLNGGPSDVAAYLGFLKSGGSKFPLPTLIDAGVDMSSPAPIERTLKLFSDRVAELEQLLG
jgi:oligoendopeptidase F